jgi:hydrogenase maturation protein HypF
LTLSAGAPWAIDPGRIIYGVLADLQRGRDTATIAAAFHGALRDLIVLGCERIREETGIAAVALTGGVFANALLTESSMSALSSRRFRVYLPRAVPCNDGGLSVGQAYVAARATQEEPCA